MANSKILPAFTKDNSFKVLVRKQANNISSLSAQIPNTGAFPIMWYLKGGQYNGSNLYGGIGLVRYYENAPAWNGAVIFGQTGHITSVTVSNTGLMTVNLSTSASYLQLFILSL